MKAKQKSLQKLTDSEIKEKEIREKINSILDLDKVMPGDTEALSNEETDSLHSEIIDKLNKLKGDEKAIFVNKVEFILTNNVKNQLWEINHTMITQIISSFISDYGRMPTKGEIAVKTELSRQTVHKHIKDYSTHPQYLLHAEQFRFMSAKVLAKVFQFAINGDISAAKLYLNIVGLTGKNSTGTLIQNQNNYIQINGTILSQETIKRLTSEQLNTIENILKTALPQALKLEG